LGLTTVVGQARGFLNIDAAVLLSEFIRFMPADIVVLEILETVVATPEVIERVKQLKQAGYMFALDDVIDDNSNVRAFQPLVDIIKIDITDLTPATVKELVRKQRVGGKLLIAEKVETVEQFNLCLELGFDCFQGYYFAKPLVMRGKKLAPSDAIILDLLQLIESDADNSQIEQRLKRDAMLSINVLRMVNTPAAGVLRRIDTLGQALMVMGRRQLQRWLHVLLYAKSGNKGVGSPLLSLAVTRAKLLELIALEQHGGQRSIADTAFAVGVMSLMDVLFALPMEEVLAKIEVTDDVRNALLSRSGRYGELLSLVEQLDNGAVPLMQLREMGLATDTLNALQIKAFEWANKVVESV
jgi:EAL and modified HD-GYP domain-containing signal transduction protein